MFDVLFLSVFKISCGDWWFELLSKFSPQSGLAATHPATNTSALRKAASICGNPFLLSAIWEILVLLGACYGLSTEFNGQIYHDFLGV